MSPENIRTIAHLLAGHEPGWQSRFAKLLGISRGYAHNVLSGERPVSGVLYIELVIAVRKRAEEYGECAAELNAVAAELGKITLGEAATIENANPTPTRR